MTPELELDPKEDRGEFERRISRNSMWTCHYSTAEAIEALMLGDQAKIDEILACKTACELHVQTWLTDWDNALDIGAKGAVVGTYIPWKKP